jgi:hypothetical protein
MYYLENISFTYTFIPKTGIITLASVSKKYRANVEVIASTMLGVSTMNNDLYFYAFKDDSLIYWGHPFQFTRIEDSTLKDIGEEAFEFSKNEYELR